MFILCLQVLFIYKIMENILPSVIYFSFEICFFYVVNTIHR